MKESNLFVQKYQTYKKIFSEMSALQFCEKVLRLFLCVIAVLYFVEMAVGLPFYFDTETDYNLMGSNKADYFMNHGFFWGKTYLFILFIYVLLATVRFIWENRKVKGALPERAGELLGGLSLTDKFAIFYGVAVFLSYYYSKYPDMAVLGAHGWYMGFLPHMLLVGAYFAISRLFVSKRDWLIKAALAGLLGTSFVVFLLGLLNRYGVNPLGMVSAGPGFISTIGNINWYCGYWSVLFPLGAGLLLFMEKDENRKVYIIKKSFLLLYTAIGFATGVTQGSDSCLLVLGGLILLAGSLCMKSIERVKRFLQMLLLFCGVSGVLAVIQKCFPERNQYVTKFYNLVTEPSFFAIAGVLVIAIYVLLQKEMWLGILRKIWVAGLGILCVTLVSVVALIVINTTNPGSIGALSENPLFTFQNSWGSARGATWSAGVRTWAGQEPLYKMIGVGPDCMAAYIYNGPDAELLESVRSTFGDGRLTNAHNEWITLLANVGLLGVLGFAGMMVSAIVRFVKGSKMSEEDAHREKSAEGKRVALCIACGLSLLCYTANNFFSFQQIMNISQMFLVLGLGEALCRSRER